MEPGSGTDEDCQKDKSLTAEAEETHLSSKAPGC